MASKRQGSVPQASAPVGFETNSFSGVRASNVKPCGRSVLPELESSVNKEQSSFVKKSGCGGHGPCPRRRFTAPWIKAFDVSPDSSADEDESPSLEELARRLATPMAGASTISPESAAGNDGSLTFEEPRHCGRGGGHGRCHLFINPVAEETEPAGAMAAILTTYGFGRRTAVNETAPQAGARGGTRGRGPPNIQET